MTSHMELTITFPADNIIAKLKNARQAMASPECNQHSFHPCIKLVCNTSGYRDANCDQRSHRFERARRVGLLFSRGSGQLMPGRQAPVRGCSREPLAVGGQGPLLARRSVAHRAAPQKNDNNNNNNNNNNNDSHSHSNTNYKYYY